MNITFERAFDEYSDFLYARLKPQAWRTSISKFRLYVLPYFKKYNIFKLNTKDIIKYQTYLMNLNYSYKYEKGIFYTLVSFLNFCRIYYDLESNVASKVGMWKNKYELEKELNIWNYTEFKQFISCVDDLIYQSLFEFLFYTGCRLGESLALSFNDISDNVLTINKTITKEFVNGKRIITPPKTKKSNRKILLDPHLIAKINDLYYYYKKKYKDCSKEFYIFGGPNPMSPTTIERRKNNYCKIAGVKQIRIHDFRHSHATLLVNNNIPINIVADRLGHSDINLTYNIYVHRNLENEKRVIETLNSLQNI